MSVVSEFWRGVEATGRREYPQEFEPIAPALDEREDIPARSPRERNRALSPALPVAIDPEMWMYIVNV